MRILLVDDDAQGRAFLADYLNLLGHDVVPADSAQTAVERYLELPFDMVLSDINMPKSTGIDLVRKLKATGRKPEAAIVLYTGHIEVQLAIDALRAGAFDYLTKPINLEELTAILERVSKHLGLAPDGAAPAQSASSAARPATTGREGELARLQSMLSRQAQIERVGIYSDAMWSVVHQAERYHSDRSIPVLIQGETGVGKEIVARIVHFGSERTTMPFVGINCAAISPTLFESELFGYEAGAFTGGAQQGRKGKLDMAMGGTLFLDEIAEIPVELQAKLLRVIEERQFYRVGGLKRHKTDIRLVAATNLDFEKRMEEGLFRRDLYFRLKVGLIRIPPLRERQDDILPLARMFLESSARKRGGRFRDISQAAADLLHRYPWPGNVRELRNAMEWVSLMHDAEVLEPEHFSNLLTSKGAVSSRDAGEKKSDAMSEHPRGRKRPQNDEVLAAIEACGGNKTRAAKQLGISLRTLYYRLERMREN